MAAPTTRHFTQLLNLTAPSVPVIPPDPPLPRVATDPYRLSLSVTHADGRITRWGPDELASQDMPTGLSFGTSIPGGFKDMSCSLLRRIDVDYADEALFDSVRVYGPGNQTAWEGRVAQLPRQHSDQFSVNPGAVGWSAHLEDDPSFREIYVDRDLSRWEGPSLQLQLSLMTGNYTKLSGPQLVPDPSIGTPILDLGFTDSWTATTRPVASAFYNGGGVPLGSIYYGWIKGPLVDHTDTLWVWTVGLSVNAEQAVSDDSGNLRGAGPGTGTIAATTTTRRFGYVQFYYNSAGGGAGGSYDTYWSCLAVYGGHGLTKRGSSGSYEAQGFYASDVVAHIVARAAPLLTYSTGSDGSISGTSFVIPHLAFTDPTTASNAISVVNGFHLYEWGVYDGREFFWRPPDPDRLTWEARLSDGAQVSLEGDDANNLFNGVFVSYTDPAGKGKTVGPPGSVADATDTTLVDTDPDNPVNAHGISRRWGLLEISNTTTQPGAIQLGAVWLAEHRLPTRRGQLTLTGDVQHPTEGKRPVWQVRAGDYIRIADRPGDPVRRIIETQYDHDTRQLTASLDQTVFKLEALMERIGVSLVGVI